MKINELELRKSKSKRRIGRGISAGQGKTAGRGTKGQKSRTGKKRKPGFEGGQNPLMQRVPKMRGFKSHITKAELVYTGQLDQLGASIDTIALYEAGLISSPYVRVKIIVRGETTKKHLVSVQEASKSAVAAIQKAGGSFTPVGRLMREKKS